MDEKAVMMEICHQLIHNKEHNFDDTVVIALDERDGLFLALALASVSILYPCLRPDSYDMQVRLKELIEAQKGEWMEPRED